MAKAKRGPSTEHRKLAGELGIEIAERLLKRLPSMAEAIAEGSPSASFTATVKITAFDATVSCKGAIPLPTQDFKINLERGQLALFEGAETLEVPIPGPDTDPDPDLDGTVLTQEEQAAVSESAVEGEGETPAGPPKGASQVEAPKVGRKPRSNVKSVSRRASGASTSEVPAIRGDGVDATGESWDDDDSYVPQPNAQIPDA